jgi:hypothetical protein
MPGTQRASRNLGVPMFNQRVRPFASNAGSLLDPAAYELGEMNVANALLIVTPRKRRESGVHRNRTMRRADRLCPGERLVATPWIPARAE